MQSIVDGANGERQAKARDRVQQQTRRLRIARMADRELRLADYYATWGWPDGRYCPVVEGWRTA
jgi:hypothetical protein